MRLRLTFAKTEAMRFTGNLDLHRTLERTLRRARLPLAYSQGFTRRVKLNLAASLPLGFTSECELAEFWLAENLPLETVAAAIREASPPGIRLIALEEAEEGGPSLQVQVHAAEFVATLLDPQPDLAPRVSALLEADSLPRTRRDKPYDLRPLIEALYPLEPDPEGRARLFMRLLARPGATGRVEEVLAALGIPPEAARVHRTRLNFEAS